MRRAPMVGPLFAAVLFVAVSAPSPMVRVAGAGEVVSTEFEISDINPATGEGVRVCVSFDYRVSLGDIGFVRTLDFEVKDNDLSPFAPDEHVTTIKASFLVPSSASPGDILHFGPFYSGFFNPGVYDPSIVDPDFYLCFDDGTTIFNKYSTSIEVEPRGSNPTGVPTPKTEHDIFANVSSSPQKVGLFGGNQKWDVALGQTQLVSVTAKNLEATSQNVRLRSRFVNNDEGTNHGYSVAPAETVVTGLAAGGSLAVSFRLTRTGSPTGLAELEAALVSDTTMKDEHALVLGEIAEAPATVPMSAWPLAVLLAFGIGGIGLMLVPMRSARASGR